MKNYILTPQENNDYCVPSILQGIFRKRGIEITQNEVADNLTRQGKMFKVHDLKIRNLFMNNGFEYFYFGHNETLFNEPDMLLREIEEHEGIIGINSHCYLLEEFKDPKIRLLNPSNTNIIYTDIYEVLGHMKNTFGFFGLVRYIF